jgi:hypothetical protein
LGRSSAVRPAGFLATQEESAKTSAKTFPPANRHFPRDEGDAETENAPQKIRELQGLSPYLNLRALYLQEARLGVETGPYFAGLLAMCRRRAEPSTRINAPTCHVENAQFAGIYGANRSQREPVCVAVWGTVVA